jgi:tetratricopeptide (TPR) repeat protein
LLPAPTYAFSADATANHPLLRHLASDSGGEYFNLNKLGDDQVLKAVGAPPFSFISVTCNQGRIAETFPSGAQTVHGRFTLTGRLLSDEAKITLNYGIAGKVLKQVPITITKQIPGETGILPTYWAQHKVDNLVVFPERNYAELLAVGKEYGLVTPATSLMVLERLDQYVQHEIEPPASLSQMRKDYLAQIAQKKAGEAKQKENKLNQVLAMWNERIKWWEMDFKYPVDFKYKEPEKEKTTTSVRVDYVLLLRQDLREEANKSVAGKVANGNNIEITLKPWNPETPYLKALQAAGVDQIYTVYLEQKKQHGGAPAFYLDCATLFFKNKQQALARRVLSNVAELMFEDPAMLRVLAYKLEEEGELELAAEVLERVLTLRPEEPQSYRDLALVYAKLKRWDRALKLLADVVLKSWDGRFNEVELIALTEFNRFLPQAESAGVKTARGLLDARLIRELPVDVRILLTWDADATDIDLWVIEPSDEKAFYGHRRTTIGGNVSRDFTQGYGPEEYLLKKTMPGKYKIQCNYYGSSQQKVQGPVTVKATVFVNYGRPNEEVKIMTLRLSDKKETVEIGEIKF